MSPLRTLLCSAVAAATALVFSAENAAADAIPVEIVQDKTGWRLERGGEPFFIKGGCVVRNTASDPDLIRLLDELKAAGGNAIRVWATGPGTLSILDAAHERGIAVMLGLWMQHSAGHVDSVGGNFDYLDPAAVQAQLASLINQVNLYKNHPAVLAWGVGNELEHLTADADADEELVAAIWTAIDDAAAIIKIRDPLHPTVAVTADMGEWHLVDNATQLATFCPNIDIWGINAYETLNQLRAKVDAGPWDRPYLIPEYGPSGWWGAPQTPWGGRIEHTSTQKADWYRDGWIGSIDGQSDRCLGGFAYLWDDLDPPTDSWFMMFGPGGEYSSCTDAMIEAWTGAPPANRAPEVSGINGVTAEVFLPGDTATASLDVSDPDGDDVVVDWLVGSEIFDENGTYLWQFSPNCTYLEIGGDATLEFEIPRAPGSYRLVAFARDTSGSIALATAPFFVDGNIPDDLQTMPFAIDDRYVPSGYMGASWTLTGSGIASPNGACAGSGHKFVFNPPQSNTWAGVAWQYPDNNWGELPGLQIMPGGESVDFYAWSDTPGTVLDFFVGTEGSDGFSVGLADVELPLEPTFFSIPISDIPYEDVTIPFGWTVSNNPTTTMVREIYISDLRWIGPPPPPPCPGDFNDDRYVGGPDLALLLTAWWGTNNPDVDLNEDGIIDAQDLGRLFQLWGPCPE